MVNLVTRRDLEVEDEEDEWEDESDMTSILFDCFDGTDEVLRPALGGFPEFQNPPNPNRHFARARKFESDVPFSEIVKYVKCISLSLIIHLTTTGDISPRI